MEFGLLGSGSGGNAVLVKSGQHAVLVDAGLRADVIAERVLQAGMDPDQITDVVITHGHIDHVKGARLGAKRWGWRIWVTEGTKRIYPRLARIETNTFEPGDILDLGPFEVRTAGVFHDAPQTVAVRVTDRRSGASVAVATDLGVVDDAVDNLLRGAGGIVIETNHDVQALWRGPYPRELKKRVESQLGHLSNEQGASAVARACHGGLEWVILAHISRENNDAAMALAAMKAAMAGKRWKGRIRVAWSDRLSGMYRINTLSPIEKASTTDEEQGWR